MPVDGADADADAVGVGLGAASPEAALGCKGFTHVVSWVVEL